MRVLVIGGGGREHALAWRLRLSPSVREVTCAPGNAGIAEVARLVPIGAEDIDGLVTHAVDEGYDLVVIGPEGPLALGLTDALIGRGLRVFGCSRAAATIEGSKKFAKEVMERAGIPTARWGAFTEAGPAIAMAESLCRESGRVVIKADGFAAGKGVVICSNAIMAREVIGWMLSGDMLGAAGVRVVVEEFLDGREASCMALVDGERVWPLAACEDHKTVLDGDRGPMTGGMGAVSPTPVVDDALATRVAHELLVPAAKALVELGRPFRGLLYAGLMLTASGPMALEFNCRFGDPETQPLMARFEGDLAAALLAVAEGRAPSVAFSPQASCCVVLAARNYPGPPERGVPITGLAEAGALEGVTLFHAGTRRDGDRIVTHGGRVLGVTAVGDDLPAARARAYAAVAKIQFSGMHFRSDIGLRKTISQRGQPQ